jgi:anti-sigma factor RsiW
MNAEQARDLFSEAYDGELAPETRSSFEGLLENDAALAEEYKEFRQFLNDTRSDALNDGDIEVSLLEGVQHRIRARSKGRFYRDRYAELPGGGWTVWILVLMIVVLGSAWMALYYVDIEELPDSEPPVPLVTEPVITEPEPVES